VANNKSALKRIRQVSKRRLRNRNVLGNMRTAVRAARAAIDAGESNAKDLIRTAVSQVDRAVQKGTIKRNAGSRLISRLSRRTAA
jgi:small subunit ribosomal protein S20